MRPTRTSVALLVVIAAAALAWWSWPFVSGAALLMDVSGAAPSVRRLLPVSRAAVAAEDLAVPTRHGAIPARVYRPDARTRRAILVVPGVHAGGVDEPRLDALSRRLSAAGAVVLSVPLPDLREYRITPAATDEIEDATLWMSGQRALAPDGRVGLIGVSFSGGLAIVAAGRPSLRDRITAVASLGGHGDLPRALRYLCTGVMSDGTRRPPHEYSAAVLLRAALPRLVPADQLAAMDRALVDYLDGSSLLSTDPARAEALLAGARLRARSFAEPSRDLMKWIEARDVMRVGALVLPFIEDISGDAALSPERSALPRAPVFLVHGSEDNVIPSSETPLLAAHFARASPETRVEWILTPLLSHADAQPSAPIADIWRLVRLWADLWERVKT